LSFPPCVSRAGTEGGIRAWPLKKKIYKVEKNKNFKKLKSIR